jgi:Domain of unknown function (DUF4145)
MPTLTHKCPHCLTEHIALRAAAIGQIRGNIAVHLDCPKCGKPSGALIEVARQQNVHGWNALMQQAGELIDLGWKATQFWPEPPGPIIPELLPPEVERVYLQAERNFPVAGNEEAAGTMYRKALDIGLKIIDPAVTGLLKARIAALVEQNKLTPSLGEWADQIRLLGNDTAHEIDQPTREELTALRNFSDLVLRYLFTLPEMVKARKAPTPPPAKP